MVDLHSHRPSQAHDLGALIDSGDWACANADPGGLAEAAHLCSLCVASPLQTELVEIERLAAVDMLAATDRWTRLAERLRQRLLAYVPEGFHR